jgi:hypothetical protein
MEISTDEILISNYGFSAEEYESFKYFLFQDENTINVPYNGTTYSISPYELMTSDVKTLTQYPFTTDSAFVDGYIIHCLSLEELSAIKTGAYRPINICLLRIEHPITILVRPFSRRMEPAFWTF